MNFSKTTLLSILLVIFFLAAGFFGYQWWQIKGELGRQIEQGVTITTDKKEYQQGEIVKITIKNNLDKPIWYIKEICDPSCCALYKWENNEWKFVKVPFPCAVFTPPPPGMKRWTIIPDKLNPGEEIRKEWNTEKDEFIEPGTYRFSFFYGLTKDFYYRKNREKIIYSNEFIIK